VLLTTQDISHVDPSFFSTSSIGSDSSIPAIDADIFAKLRGDLDDGRRIADEVGLTTEHLSGSVTVRDSHLVGFSMTYDSNSAVWTMKVNGRRRQV
jgi:hypothetical protein